MVTETLPEISPGAKKILAVIAAETDPGEEVQLSHQRLAKLAGLHKRWMAIATNRLEELGLLDVHTPPPDDRGPQPRRYRVTDAGRAYLLTLEG